MIRTNRVLPFVLAASDHGPMIVNRLDYHILSNGATYGVGHQILTNGAYDPSEILDVLEILKARRESVGPGLMALDCGANIGVHTVEMAKYMTGWGRVFAVEAQERLYYALCGNIALSNLFNASAILAAIGSTEGEISVPQPNYLKPASFGSVELRHSSTTEYVGQSVSYAPKDLKAVPMVTIDYICRDSSRVDFIKLDVEGMEIEALNGAANVISQFRPALLVEWIKSDRTALEDLLRSRYESVTERGANLLAIAGGSS